MQRALEGGGESFNGQEGEGEKRKGHHKKGNIKFQHYITVKHRLYVFQRALLKQHITEKTHNRNCRHLSCKILKKC